MIHMLPSVSFSFNVSTCFIHLFLLLFFSIFLKQYFFPSTQHKLLSRYKIVLPKSSIIFKCSLCVTCVRQRIWWVSYSKWTFSNVRRRKRLFSSSKEFMDTRSLVTHAFMSHKTGLRAKHLGLHQAICVMMGWDTTVPQDTVTWAPQVLPHAETLAQKEDLILWPPVVIIHNISMSDDNPQNWKVISMETIEAFIRGKGFVRGRIKLCLGKPADQSTILVKFLGTFVGLGDAERIHKYLSDNNRGRADYEKIKSEGVKSCNIRETDQGDQVESFLYGYVAIAEDLEKLDFNSKSWSSVKSRKEIDDLDKAPVKTDEMR